ncbi:MAG: hypothetical protein HYT83_01630 [Candidatus Levybacteria bacterium]|nr:hypothetical protein [Candidatus Levybacteria bacterium]
MQSFIITVKNKKLAEEYLSNFYKEKNISPFDINVVEQEKSVGIESIRIIQKNLYLTPIKDKLKAIVIKNAETLTIEAQNALLKILEEPPPAAIIILITSNVDSLLPTVISRCRIIELNDKQSEYSKKELDEYQKVLETLMSAGIGEKLKLAQDLSGNKEEALLWLKKMILVLRNWIIENISVRQPIRLSSSSPSLRVEDSRPKPQGSEAKYLNLLTSFQKTHTIISTTNVSPRLILENLFLRLSDKI